MNKDKEASDGLVRSPGWLESGVCEREAGGKRQGRLVPDASRLQVQPEEPVLVGGGSSGGLGEARATISPLEVRRVNVLVAFQRGGRTGETSQSTMVAHRKHSVWLCGVPGNPLEVILGLAQGHHSHSRKYCIIIHRGKPTLQLLDDGTVNPEMSQTTQYSAVVHPRRAWVQGGQRSDLSSAFTS